MGIVRRITPQNIVMENVRRVKMEVLVLVDGVVHVRPDTLGQYVKIVHRITYGMVPHVSHVRPDTLGQYVRIVTRVIHGMVPHVSHVQQTTQ